MESPYLLILSLSILFLIFPFSFNIKIAYNVKTNDGFLSIKVWKITLHNTGLKRKGKSIILIQKRDTKSFEIEVSSEQLRFLKMFLTEVKNKIRIKKLEIKTETGVNNPFKSAMFSGFISSFILSIFARLKTLQPTAAFQLNNNTNFYDYTLNAESFLRVSISIFDVFYSLIIAILKKDKI